MSALWVSISLTVLIWILAILWPWPASRSDYDFTGMFVAIFRLGGSVIATLVVWLTFFAARAV